MKSQRLQIYILLKIVIQFIKIYNENNYCSCITNCKNIICNYGKQEFMYVYCISIHCIKTLMQLSLFRK